MKLEERIAAWKASGTKIASISEMADPLFCAGVLYGMELALGDIQEKNNKKLQMDAVCPKCKESVKVIDGWASCVCGATYYTTEL